MDTKEKIAAISKIVFGSEEVVEETFLDVKTSDGVVLRVSELSEGETVAIISEDGENVSGAAEYVLEDGTTVVVDAEGVITSVEVAEEETEEVVEEEEMSEEATEEVNPLEERIAQLEDGIEKILSKFSEVSDAINTTIETTKNNSDAIAKFSEAPAEEEIEVNKKTPLELKKSNAIEGLRNFRNNK